MTQDPEILARPELRQPLDEVFGWLRHRIADILAEGQARGELSADLEPIDSAATIIAVLQGGYVVARAANSVEPFTRAIDGVLRLLARAKTVPR